ncbi:hypothetical protein E2C01_041417 [Portunus trituberculatus]|uniref:Uncharacterized protein n=1 Tax=Portunus trituberculatus TaxID=210409 RepID=A0A5B7FRN9_PORTR|nr:hypothetical protein [Portunus trituberculatus]
MFAGSVILTNPWSTPASSIAPSAFHPSASQVQWPARLVGILWLSFESGFEQQVHNSSMNRYLGKLRKVNCGYPDVMVALCPW